LVRRSEEEKDKKSLAEKLKIALFDILLSNVKAINKLNLFESMRAVFCVTMPLILPPDSM
jgi:hypothetical protein